jgi:F-type H+-transporting ATPase subunit delta
MKQKIIAQRYAEAIFGIGCDHGKQTEYGNLLAEVAQVIHENPELARVLQHPVIKREDKHETLRQLFGQRLPQDLLHFLYLLVNKKRENYIQEIAAEYQHLLNELNRTVITDVTTAVPMFKKTQNILQKQLEGYLDQSVVMNCHVDPTIIGGVVIKIGDRMIDASLRTQLSELAHTLI